MSDRQQATEPGRTIVLYIPDWPATAAGLAARVPPHEPLAVLRAGRVVAANAVARHSGITEGLTKRTTQLRCPELQLAGWDPDRDHRIFADSIGVLENLVARFTLISPGVVSVPVAALAHAYPDEESAVEAILTGATDATGWEFFAGIAGTVFAAVLAAQQSVRVAPGATGRFLAAQPVTGLAEADASAFTDLITVLTRLGITTLGQFAGLTTGDVAGRFGALGLRAHRLAGGTADTPVPDHVRARTPEVSRSIDPPAARTDTVSFHAKALAGDLLAEVTAAGLVCTQLTIELTAVTGETSRRAWRVEGLGPTGFADRVRWQADGWLTRMSRTSSDVDLAEDGITAITMAAVELVTPLDNQSSLFDRQSGPVSHTLGRLQGLFGPEAVLVPVLQGGREPAETNLWTPWQHLPAPDRDAEAPWPGQLPAPRPAQVTHVPVTLTDDTGTDVVARPAGLDSAPAVLAIPGEGRLQVTGFSAPWPVNAHWWDLAHRQYKVRLQVVTAGGTAFLLCKEHGQWFLTGRYV